MSARPTPTRCRLRVASPLPEGHRGYPSSASLHVPGETLGPSKQGVYYTAIHGYQLYVWVLHNTSQSSQTPEWELKHQVDLEPNLKPYYYRRFTRENIDKYWILDSHDEESEDTRDYEWDSSDDSIANAEGEINRDCKDYYFALDLLGYHPYKEIAFLGNHFQGFAYYFWTTPNYSIWGHLTQHN